MCAVCISLTGLKSGTYIQEWSGGKGERNGNGNGNRNRNRNGNGNGNGIGTDYGWILRTWISPLPEGVCLFFFLLYFKIFL